MLAILLLAVLPSEGRLSGQTAAREQAPPSDPNAFLKLSLPKAHATAFFKAWTQASADLENGRLDEARKGFAAVLSLLGELDSNPARREQAILIKARVHALILGDRTTARRELARVLAVNPISAEALALESRLNAQERKPDRGPEKVAPPSKLTPRLGRGKEAAP